MTKKERAKGYPYLIPPFPPQSSIAQHPHPWGVALFFRIEALLRSPRVRAAYEEDPTHRKFMSFFKPLWDEIPQKLVLAFFPPDWNESPLNGKYRYFICVDVDTPDNELDEDFAREGCVNNYIADLAVIMKRGPSQWWPQGGEVEILQQLRNPDPRFLYFRVDVSREATPTLEALRPFLDQGHERYMQMPTDNFFDRFYKAETPFRDFEAWRRYFQCYDLQETTDLSIGEITDQVYGVGEGSASTTSKFLGRVRKVIKFAEDNIWPPPDTN